MGAVRRAVVRQLQGSYPGITDVAITYGTSELGLDYTTGAGNVPDTLRGFAAAGVRGIRQVQPSILDGVGTVRVSANGDQDTFPIDDLDDPDLGPGAN